MPRQTAIAVDNDFKNGLITQATGLNFPPNAVTETFNCEFNIDGSVSRRLGFDFESDFITKTIDRTNAAVSSYLWKNVSGDGNVSIIVTQVGSTLYFYRISVGHSFSSGAVSTTVTLVPVLGAPDPITLEAQYSDGNGLLFVTHPYCEPMRISYDIITDIVTATNIIIKIRDFEGAVADTTPTTTRIATGSSTTSHDYNLLNQGWTSNGLGVWNGVDGTRPSHADIMWRFKDTANNLDFSATSRAKVTAGNTPSPKGHYILTLSNQDRNTASGLSGVASTTTGFQRPSTTAFFAGRVFYTGINSLGFNSTVYFTQIVERPEQYGNCYQTNDPTSEDLFDLLPSDGGVISIPDAGTIYKLVAVPGGLGIFAANGVWFLSGSSGIGFTANDYTVQRLALIPTLSATSFVNVGGLPAWWNAEGIYIITYETGGTFGAGSQLPTIKALTYSTIKTFYDSIPLNAKKYARGAYDRLNGRIRWIYKSTDTLQVTSIYEFDRVLNLNINTGAFYPWTITTPNVQVNSIVIADAQLGTLTTNNVMANGLVDNVVDNLGNQVISFETSGLANSPFDVYLVSYPNGAGSYNFTFSTRSNANYLDWFKFDFLGMDYDSYFITGYKLTGQAIKKFQDNWVRVFSRVNTNVEYFFQGIWDFSKTGSGTGRWSTRQHAIHNNLNYASASKRLKVRGNGLALQFKVKSVQGQAFDIIGWSAAQSVNAIP